MGKSSCIYFRLSFGSTRTGAQILGTLLCFLPGDSWCDWLGQKRLIKRQKQHAQEAATAFSCQDWQVREGRINCRAEAPNPRLHCHAQQLDKPVDCQGLLCHYLFSGFPELVASCLSKATRSVRRDKTSRKHWTKCQDCCKPSTPPSCGICDRLTLSRKLILGTLAEKVGQALLAQCIGADRMEGERSATVRTSQAMGSRPLLRYLSLLLKGF